MSSQLFDPGLQPERTHLAWRRTALAIAVGSLVSMRVMPAVAGSVLWCLPGVVGVVFATWMWRMAHQRYVRFNEQLEHAPTTPSAAGGGPLVLTSSFVIAVGMMSLVAVGLRGA